MSELQPDELLWRQFAETRTKEGNLNDHLDLPCIFQEILPSPGSNALDLGCGLGQSSFYLAEKLGYDVLAVDASAEMLAHAQKLYPGKKIRWKESKFENLDVAPGSVQLIVACLSFHFVENLDELLKRCCTWLSSGGMLIFSVRHPIRTCNPIGELRTGDGISWDAKDYFVEGARQFDWLGARCVNFHRTFSSYIKMIAEAGFALEKVMEPSDLLGTSDVAAESRSVPFFLTLFSRKH